MEENKGPGNRMIPGAEDQEADFNTYRSIMKGLQMGRVEAFRTQLTSMIRPRGRGGFSKKQVEDMVAGFESGFSDAIQRLKEMQILKINEDK